MPVRICRAELCHLHQWIVSAPVSLPTAMRASEEPRAKLCYHDWQTITGCILCAVCHRFTAFIAFGTDEPSDANRNDSIENER